MWTEWVIDGAQDVCFCFVPVEGGMDNPTFVTGMNILGSKESLPLGSRVVGVIHAAGQDAAEAYYSAHKSEIDAMMDVEEADDG